MNNFKISTRLMLLIGLLSALLVAIGAIGLFGISQSNAALQTVYEDRTIPMGQLAELNLINLKNRLLIAGAQLNPTPEEISKNTAEVEANVARFTQIWQNYQTSNQTEEEARLAKKLFADRTRFVQEGLLPTIAALRANNMEEAKRLSFEKNRPLYNPVGEGMAALQKHQIEVPSKNTMPP